MAVAALCAPAANAAPRARVVAVTDHHVRVRVQTPRTENVRLFATVGRGIVATRVRDVRVRRSRVVRLRLDRAGVAGLQGCGRKRLVLSAALAGTPQSGPGPATKRARGFRGSRCAKRIQAARRIRAAAKQPEDYSTPADADRCDWLDKAVCLQPWPNDYFTTDDG